MYKNTVRQVIHFWLEQCQLAHRTYPTVTDMSRMQYAKDMVVKYYPLRHTNLVILTHENLRPQRKYN